MTEESQATAELETVTRLHLAVAPEPLPEPFAASTEPVPEELQEPELLFMNTAMYAVPLKTPVRNGEDLPTARFEVPFQADAVPEPALEDAPDTAQPLEEVPEADLASIQTLTEAEPAASATAQELWLDWWRRNERRLGTR